MRIGMFVDMYLPHMSGVTNQVQLMSAGLRQKGHEVVVFTWGRRTPDEDAGGTPVHHSFGIPWGRSGWQLPIGVSAEASALMRTVDVAHAHHPFTSTRTALSRCNGAPVVFTNHTRYDIYADHYARFVPPETRNRIVRKRLTSLSAEVAVVLAPSPEIARWLRSCGADPSRVRVFPNAVDASFFAHPRDPMTKADLGFRDDSHVIAHVGRLASEKNLSLLMDACINVMCRDERVCMVVAGDGPLKPEFERAAASAGLSDRINFLGLIDHEQLPDVLSAADSFVTASTSETFALVVMEAAAAGLPVVGVRSPGVGEVVLDGKTGLLVGNDSDEIAAALTMLTTDSALARRLGTSGAVEAEKYDVDTATDRLLTVYEEVLHQA